MVTTGYPPLDFVHPDRGRSAARGDPANRSRPRRVDRPVAARRSAPPAATARRLLDCSDVRHPRKRVRPRHAQRADLPVRRRRRPRRHRGDRGRRPGVLLGRPALRRHHVRRIDAGAGRRADDLRAGRSPPPSAPTCTRSPSTGGGRRTSRRAGSAGMVKDRWSFSEHDGRLRVAARAGPQLAAVRGQRGGRARRAGGRLRRDRTRRRARQGRGRSSRCAGSATSRSW